MRQDDHSLRDLASQLVQLFVSLFDLFVQGLVLDFELLEIYQVETIGQLFLLLQDFLFIGQLVSESNVLEPILMDFLVFQGLTVLPLTEGLGWNLLTRSGEHSILRHTSLQLLELLFDLMALGLLLVQFGLQLRSHLVVPVLGFLKVDSDLMHISQGVEVLVLVHLYVWLLVVLLVVLVHHDDLLLELLVFSS